MGVWASAWSWVRFERGHHVAGHAGDDDACAAGGDDGAELVEEQRGTDEVDGEDRFARWLARVTGRRC